jgi:hypothetical protein
MTIIKHSELTAEAMDVYFNHPHRWTQYLRDLSNSGDFQEHQHWYLYYCLPQIWEEEERRSPGSIKEYIREDLFYQNFQLIKMKAAGINPPENLVQKVAQLQQKFDAAMQKVYDDLKDSCEKYNRQKGW